MGTRVERLRRNRSRTLLTTAVALAGALLAGALATGVQLWYGGPMPLARAAPEPVPTPVPSETVWPVPVWDADEPAHGVALSYRCADGNLAISSQVTNIKGEPLGDAGLELSFLDETATVGVTEAAVPPLEVGQTVPVEFASTVPCAAGDTVTRLRAELLFCDPAPRKG
jgi:hypothetical protein